MATSHIPQPGIVSYGIHVDVINRSTIDGSVFIETFSLVKHLLYALIVSKLAALIPHTDKSFIGLVSVQELTGRNIHQQYTVKVAIVINAIHIPASDRNRRVTEIERHAK